MDSFPTWLKSNQNGYIGEIRTKSFLLNRFWVLERSVDIHGADFLIQRRILEKNLLDDEPTRFGVVQAKFSENNQTTHKLKKSYVIDNDGNPRNEFFLIIHTGNEEHQRMFLLTSKEITNDFSTNEKNEFIIPSRKLFASQKYQVIEKKISLDRIENHIQYAEFYKNRLFAFSGLSSGTPDLDGILPEYKENFDYWFGSIAEAFKEQKQKVFNVMRTLEEIHAYFISFLESTDPMEASLIGERWEHEFGSSISMPEIHQPGFSDFYRWSRFHKGRIDDLRNDGVLDNYLSARKKIISEANSFLQDLSSKMINRNTRHEITIEYNPETLKFKSLSNSIYQMDANEGFDFSKIIRAREGHIVFYWKAGLVFDSEGIAKMNEFYLDDVMEKIYKLKYCENEEIE